MSLSSAKKTGSTILYNLQPVTFGSDGVGGKKIKIDENVPNSEIDIDSSKNVVDLTNSKTKLVFDKKGGNTYIVNKGVSPTIFLNKGSKVVDNSEKNVSVSTRYGNLDQTGNPDQTFEHHGDGILQIAGRLGEHASVTNDGKGTIFVPDSLDATPFDAIEQYLKQLPNKGSGDILLEKESNSVGKLLFRQKGTYETTHFNGHKRLIDRIVS